MKKTIEFVDDVHHKLMEQYPHSKHGFILGSDISNSKFMTSWEGSSIFWMHRDNGETVQTEITGFQTPDDIINFYIANK